jgi:alkanesulfonate monooxygenase SsuD/methylene tetrahydromethanopterin reductase-like flavin-dependent oxidoreductase (luciferase family)
MKIGAFLFGGVEMDDAGAGLPAPTDRRYSNAEMWRASEQMLEMGVLSDQLGYDSYWLTEHHFQYEGYEVVPNGLMFGAILAERTENIRIGTMFNIVGQWHPLRLAEDFATLHNISGGRGILGVGRGTVPREARALGTDIGSFDNPDQAAADTLNRKQFDEAMQVIDLALNNETFSFKGDLFEYPPPGIPDRGGFVENLTLVPRPLHPYETWQAITSPPTLETVPRKGYGGVFWLKHFSFAKQFWDRYAELHDETFGGSLAPGAKRTLVLTPWIADTKEQAMAEVRDGHDEFWKFLGPYGWSRGYMGPDGKPSAPGLIPTLEESMANKTWLVGTADDVIEGIEFYKEHLGGLDNLIIFPNMPGDDYSVTAEQLTRFAEDVMPKIQ